MAKIFLCHANEDKPQIRKVYKRLQEEGFYPWLDEGDLLPGQLWDQEIRRVMRESDFVMIFFSRNSVNKIGYVQNEFKLALEVWRQIPEGMIHTIPIRLDNCDIPEQFKEFHCVDLGERGFERIRQSIRSGLAQRHPRAKDPEKPLESLSILPVMLEALTSISIPLNIALRIDNPSNLPKAIGSKQNLKEVFTVIIQNAIDVMSEGGILSIVHAFWEVGSYVIIQIQDTGVGIPEEHQDKIFQAFFTTKKDTTGVGLWFARHYITSLGGRIELENRLGTGATFIVKLPAYKSKI